MFFKVEENNQFMSIMNEVAMMALSTPTQSLKSVDSPPFS